jgi:hypothetical protein
VRVLRSDVLPQIGIVMMLVSLIGLAVGASYGWSVVVTIFQQIMGIGSLLLLVGFIAWGSRYWTLTRRRRAQSMKNA